MNPESGNPPLPERRHDLRLREIFDGAALHLAHQFHGHDDWSGTSHDFLALRSLHERYPELSTAEVRSLATAIGQRLQTDGYIHKLTA
jgi:hypothetical protein